jgi:hypothetical protein
VTMFGRMAAVAPGECDEGSRSRSGDRSGPGPSIPRRFLLRGQLAGPTGADCDIYIGSEFRIDVSSEAGSRFDQNVTDFRAEEEFGFNATPYLVYLLLPALGAICHEDSGAGRRRDARRATLGLVASGPAMT